MTDKFEIHIIELRKVKREYQRNNKDKKLQWLMFLDDPNKEEVTSIMEKNEGVKEAVVTVRKMSEDEKMKRLAFLREKTILDEKAMYSTGVSDGQKKKVIEIAKAMIEEKIDIKVISKTTKLTIEEIKKLMK